MQIAPAEVRTHALILNRGRTTSGKRGQNFERLLTPEQCVGLQQTCPALEVGQVWQATLNMAEFFDAQATDLAHRFDLPYPQVDAQRVQAHLRYVRTL